MRSPLLAKLLRDAEGAKTDFVCHECLGDPMLKLLQGHLLGEKICMGCGTPTTNALEPDRIARFIRPILPSFYMVDDGAYPFALNLEQVVGHAVSCKHAAVRKAIAAHLVDPDAGEDEFYCPEQEYGRTPSPFESEEDERWFVVGEWNSIAHELKHGQRFFNHKVRLFFEELITEALDARVEGSPDACPAVKLMPTGTEFFRARLAHNMREAKTFQDEPADELGAPPKERSANNRMSAAGIPLLYVASDPNTSIAEVRPSLHDTVVVGRFTSKREMRFFDFTALSGRLSHAPLSIFDPKYESRAMRRRLLGYLHKEIAKPVRFDDTDYVVTQALAEFIRYGNALDFDGVIFQSVQRDQGINYVLFDKASTSNEMLSADWRARFDLEISASDVTIYEIASLSYQAEKKERVGA